MSLTCSIWSRSWVVRNRASEIGGLLVDVEKIRTERRKAKSNKTKFSGQGNDGGMSFVTSSGSRYGGFGSDSLGGGSSYQGGGSNYDQGASDGMHLGGCCRAHVQSIGRPGITGAARNGESTTSTRVQTNLTTNLLDEVRLLLGRLRPHRDQAVDLSRLRRRTTNRRSRRSTCSISVMMSRHLLQRPQSLRTFSEVTVSDLIHIL